MVIVTNVNAILDKKSNFFSSEQKRLLENIENYKRIEFVCSAVFQISNNLHICNLNETDNILVSSILKSNWKYLEKTVTGLDSHFLDIYKVFYYECLMNLKY